MICFGKLVFLLGMFENCIHYTVQICSYVELCESCENGDKPGQAKPQERPPLADTSSFLLSHHQTVSQGALRQPRKQQVSLNSISCISQINSSHHRPWTLQEASHTDKHSAQDFGRQFPPTTTPNALIALSTLSFSINCKLTCLL
jgi:hypothetical protein